MVAMVHQKNLVLSLVKQTQYFVKVCITIVIITISM